MDLRHSVNLLTSATLAILILLSVMIGYGISSAPPTPEETNFYCGVTNPPGVTEDASYTNGKKVWNANGCGACHNKSMQDDAVGPALAGVTERWSEYPREDLYAWIRNNPKLTASGHPRAVEVSEAYPGVMNTYPNLTDEDMEALFAYIETQYIGN